MNFHNQTVKVAVAFWERFKWFYRLGISLLILVTGYLSAQIYVWEPVQQLIKAKDSVEGLDSILRLDSLIAQKLTSLLAIFFFVTASAMYYFWRNQEHIETINTAIRKVRFVLKLPSSFLLGCWLFVTGFSLYAYLHVGQVGLAIFLVGSTLFAMPALMFMWWLKNDFFKPIEHRWQEVLYPWVIGVFLLSAVACILYSPISLFFSIWDWIEFIQLHWPSSQ
ncbi:hypothetical protein LJ739_07950 [Aestuariibacter halophilus]|uniref:Uncharacterized protein n=1 Tax=Fluctibacter halophilus TaxID=226011 RepID=A0ABS8G6E8_9ALTE|nr:hypothetical protein [Aestuariibacter halophilus]MCC2616169.1 hypothetical protein [Aestuariibacter halophilus]